MPVYMSPAGAALWHPVPGPLGAAGAPITPRYQVRFPGFDDVVHVVPKSALSPAEARARSARVRDDLQSSPSPDIVRHLTELGTQIDNVQDGLVTLSVLGRLATKVVGRAIPGVGAIATLADVLNAINVFYPPIPGVREFPTITHIKEAGQRLRRWEKSLEQKRLLGQLSGLATGTYARRLEETLKTGKLGFGWGEALQILQTTDQLAGFGVALGPIFGAAQDVIFGLLRGARFDLSGPVQAGVGMLEALKDVAFPFRVPTQAELATKYAPGVGAPITVDFPGVFPLADQILNLRPGTTEAKVTEVLQPLAKPADRAVVATLNAIGTVYHAGVSAAISVFNAGKWLAGVRGAVSWETHVDLLVANYLALQTISPLLQASDWGSLMRPVAQKRVDPTPYPFVDRSSTGQPGALSAALRDGPARFPLDWVAEAPTEELRIFTQSLISSYVDLLFVTLEGPEARVSVRSSDPARALLALHDLDLLPPFDRSDEQLRGYLEGVTRIVSQLDTVLPPRALVEKVFVDSFPGGDPS